MNVMILSAGRQALLIEAFQEAVGLGGRVIACDVNLRAAALAVADVAEQLPAFSLPEYAEQVIRLCIKHRVGLLLTLHVDELRMLESFRSRLSESEVQLVGAPIESIDIAQDKYATVVSLCHQLGVNAPQTWLATGLLTDLPEDSSFILKPRYGRGSRGIKRTSDLNALRKAIQDLTKDERETYIIQEFIKGQEYGLDIINDLNREYQGLLARRKLAMRGGETDVAETVAPAPFEAFAKMLSAKLGHQGCMDVDIVMDEAGSIVLLDINLRFGGGYAFSHMAGARVPRCLTAWMSAVPIDKNWLTCRIGTTGARASKIIELDSH